MGTVSISFYFNQVDTDFQNEPKAIPRSPLACLLVDFSSATFPLTFASNGIWASPASLGTASVADAALPTVAVSGGAVLLGALGLTIGKALLLRRLTGRTGRRFGRKKREALPEISDEDAAKFITELLLEYQQAYE